MTGVEVVGVGWGGGVVWWGGWGDWGFVGVVGVTGVEVVGLG